jgi:hypothetical protein
MLALFGFVSGLVDLFIASVGSSHWEPRPTEFLVTIPVKVSGAKPDLSSFLYCVTCCLSRMEI